MNFQLFFHFEKNIPKMILKDQHVRLGTNVSYSLITDVVNDYFTRETSPGSFKFVWTDKNEKNEELVNLAGGPDLDFGKCKFRITIPNEFKAGDNKVLKIYIGKKNNKEEFILKVFMTILEKQSQKKSQKNLPRKPSKKNIDDKLRDDIKNNPDGNVDDSNVASELVLPHWCNKENWEEKTEKSYNDYEVLRIKKRPDTRDSSGKSFKYTAYLNEDNIFLLKERKNEKANYTWNMMKQRWWLYYVWLINGGLVQHRIDKKNNRLITVDDLFSESNKAIKPEDVEVIEITARSVAMSVFLQQKNLIQSIGENKNSREDNLANYDENAEL